VGTSRLHALVAVNGECSASTLDSIDVAQFDTLVAVDGGLRHLHSLGVVADWLIGDMDSVDSASTSAAVTKNTQMLRHPAAKDATDLQLALEHLQKLAYTHVSLLGATGGRTDHSLVNILLLGRSDWSFKIDLLTPQGLACVVTLSHPFQQALAKNTEISLVPLTTDVRGVCCSGLRYPLDNACIELGSSLGISNVVVTTPVTVSVKHGKLLLLQNCVH